MNPFDWYGPQFLLFYLLFGCFVLAAVWVTRHDGESAEPPQVDLADPYLIAFLRGGKNEALRIATVSLIDRGYLHVSGSTLSAGPDRSAASLRAPLEQDVFRLFQTPREAALLFKEAGFDSLMSGYEKHLSRLDLLPANTSARDLRLTVCVLVLAAVAALKIVVALSRGRSNIQFLTALAVIFIVIAFKLGRPRLTRRGEAMINSLRTLFAGLKERRSTLAPGANPTELTLLAAVFGVGVLPVALFPHAKKLYPKAASGDSSCGSACGSSCGSGCGGGGCGGGCGGCGS